MTGLRLRRFAAGAVVALAGAGAPPPSEAGAANAGVASANVDATDAGIAVLEAGGNAVDAALSAALVLAVVHPEAGNLGGGGFAVVKLGDTVAALDFRETAPAAASAAMFLDAGGEPRPGASDVGPLAAGVPGSPAGYFELHRRFGRLPWRRVVAPAIALARDGFEVSVRTAQTLVEQRDDLARFPETAALWLPGGVPLGAGSRLALPDLARTLALYAERGPAAITTGDVARAIEAASRRHGGVLTAADLAGYRPEWREPLRFERFGWSFATMPLPSSGGVLVGESLGLLERLGWSALEGDSAERAHLLIEVFRRAFADRFDLGDPAAAAATPAALLDVARLDRLAAAIDRRRAGSSRAVRSPAATLAPEPSETTHVAAIDADGGLVALNATLNDNYGSALWVPGAGFFLNDEMDDFTTAPGRANAFGLIQGEANAVAPGRRPLSSMSPTLLWRGAESMAIGGRGGSRIITGTIQVLLRLFDGDAPLAAVVRPRLHHQWLPERVELEVGALPAHAKAELERRGHALVGAVDNCKINLVHRRVDGAVDVAADPRAFESARAVALAPRPGESR